MDESGTPTNASIVRQEFGGMEAEVRHETAMTAVAARAKAMIEARFIVAMKRPRNRDVVRQKLLSECKVPAFAKTARYRLPRGRDRDTGKENFIEGPSIRFAEAALRCLGNVSIESTIIYDDPQKSILRISVTDLESNLPYESEITVGKHVERRFVKKGQNFLSKRVNSYGDQVFLVEATEDEVLMKTNALVSKAIRTLGLRHLPGDIQDEAMRLCQQISQADDARDPQAAKKRLFDSFFELGIPVDQLQEYLGHANTPSPAELEDLRAVYVAVRDGESPWADILEHRRTQRAPAAPQPAATTETPGAAPAISQTPQAAPVGGSKVDDILARTKATLGDRRRTANKPPSSPHHDPETGEVQPREPGSDG